MWLLGALQLYIVRTDKVLERTRHQEPRCWQKESCFMINYMLINSVFSHPGFPSFLHEHIILCLLFPPFHHFFPPFYYCFNRALTQVDVVYISALCDVQISSQWSFALRQQDWVSQGCIHRANCGRCSTKADLTCWVDVLVPTTGYSEILEFWPRKHSLDHAVIFNACAAAMTGNERATVCALQTSTFFCKDRRFSVESDNVRSQANTRPSIDEA